MMVLPLAEILFFLAVFFAPEGANAFTIEAGEGRSISYVKTEEGWRADEDGSVWRVEGQTVIAGDSEEHLGKFAELAQAHDWSEQSILVLPHGFEVAKQQDGLIVYPNGAGDPSRKIAITYATESE